MTAVAEAIARDERPFGRGGLSKQMLEEKKMQYVHWLPEEEVDNPLSATPETFGAHCMIHFLEYLLENDTIDPWAVNMGLFAARPCIFNEEEFWKICGQMRNHSETGEWK